MAEQVFDRGSAAEEYRDCMVEYGLVISDVLRCEVSYDTLSVQIPCYAAPEAMLCRSTHLGPWNHRLCRPRLLHRESPGLGLEQFVVMTLSAGPRYVPG